MFLLLRVTFVTEEKQHCVTAVEHVMPSDQARQPTIFLRKTLEETIFSSVLKLHESSEQITTHLQLLCDCLQSSCH